MKHVVRKNVFQVPAIVRLANVQQSQKLVPVDRKAVEDRLPRENVL